MRMRIASRCDIFDSKPPSKYLIALGVAAHTCSRRDAAALRRWPGWRAVGNRKLYPGPACLVVCDDLPCA